MSKKDGVSLMYIVLRAKGVIRFYTKKTCNTFSLKDILSKRRGGKRCIGFHKSGNSPKRPVGGEGPPGGRIFWLVDTIESIGLKI